MNPKIIFLDFDGCLNSTDWAIRVKAAAGKKVKFWNMLDEVAVARVNKIIEGTGAKVVVSSSWRCFSDTNTVPLLQDLLNKFGFAGEVIGMTPIHSICEHEPFDCDDAHRGHEIQAYLRDTYQEPNTRPPFIIIDDSRDMEPLMDRLVRTDGQEGLQDIHVAQAIALLNA